MAKTARVEKKDKVKATENKEGRIASLLKSYGKLDKKDLKDGRSIRRKLRRLGYKLSEHIEKKAEEKKEK